MVSEPFRKSTDDPTMIPPAVKAPEAFQPEKQADRRNAQNKYEEPHPALEAPDTLIAPLLAVQATCSNAENGAGCLQFSNGDRIQVLGIDNRKIGWWYGFVNNQIGGFRTSWVKRLGTEELGPAPVSQIIALNDCSPLHPNTLEQLSYRAGDKINVLGVLNGDWWQGQNEHTDQVGYFHSRYAIQPICVPTDSPAVLTGHSYCGPVY